jgi:hydroxymethylglutaryl-CoA lyase
MADLERRPGVRYPVLVPNQRGLERALAAGADAFCVFTAASEAFTRANINMSIAESLTAFAPVLERARRSGWWTRGYVSTAFGCPYQGEVGPAAVVGVAQQLLQLGVDEVSIGDTIGVAVPGDVRRIVGALLNAGIAPRQLAMHFHDTRGTALANVAAALELGIRCFDASTGGAGGCPYAPGASGNLATEDLVYLLDHEGMTHGVSLDGVLEAARYVAGTLGRPLASRVGQAGGWRPQTA